jgi:hypothetical protein
LPALLLLLLLADEALPDAAGTGELVLEAAEPSLAESPE